MSRSEAALTDATSHSQLGLEVSESRLRPPSIRPGIVPRTGLLERLDSAPTPVLAVVAPAGYGKSTLLRQWAELQDHRIAWLTADAADNETVVLASHLVTALANALGIDEHVREAIVQRRPPRVWIERAASWLADAGPSFALVIDNADALTNPECISMLTEIALRMPFEGRMLVATREPMPWPAARMRAEGRLADFGVRDLALDLAEAEALLGSLGVTLPNRASDELLERTEGWAAALYLSALAIQAGAPADRTASLPQGDHPYLAEYLRSELLDRLSADEVKFLTRTSVLEQFNGRLCNAVVGTEGSEGRLADLAKRNLMVLAVDPVGEWYRFHPVFRDLLTTDLDRRERAVIPELHARAADWYEAEGLAELALPHAQAAGDGERSVRLVLRLAGPAFNSGRAMTALNWLQWTADQRLQETNAALAAEGAVIYALAGRPVDADQWADVAERAPLPLLSDGTPDTTWLHVMRAQLMRSGPEAALADAAVAYERFPSDTPQRPGMLFAQGANLWAQSDDETADIFFVRAHDAALAIDARPTAAMALSERAAIAVSAGAWNDAIDLVDGALALIDSGKYDEYWTSAIVFAWAARVALYQHDHARARAYLVRASRLRPLMTYASALVSMQVLLEIGRTCLGLADPAGARSVLRQAGDIAAQRPHLGRLGPELQALRQEIDSTGTAPAIVGASSLTAAELRLVPLLATHLTLREIGEQLYVSRNTVSTQTSSIYRKLGVSSRSDAVTALRNLGLLVQ